MLCFLWLCSTVSDKVPFSPTFNMKAHCLVKRQSQSMKPESLRFPRMMMSLHALNTIFTLDVSVAQVQ